MTELLKYITMTDLIINGKDARQEWGISLSDGALSALMTPAPNKAYITSRSRQEHGSVVINANPKVDERSLSLPIHLTAPTKELFFERYERFCNEVLATGVVDIVTKFQPNITYKCIYESCSQFSQFEQGIGKFILKLIEPDPTNRS